jgi:tetratricopeptide (TPR) repeat protein
VTSPSAPEVESDIGQVEQMYQSRCFVASSGKLGCISCHDPHTVPAEETKARYFRDRCLECHHKTDCSVPESARLEKSKEDSCIQCHMPRAPLAGIAHTAATDHRILRNPAKTPANLPPTEGAPETLLVNFYQNLLPSPDAGADRDMGIALAQFSSTHPAHARAAASQALPRLQKAVQDHPDDLPALEALATALWQSGRQLEALAVSDKAIQLAPEREFTLNQAASFAESWGRKDIAIDYWQRLVQLNPWFLSYRTHLVNMLTDREQWAAATEPCREVLRRQPANADMRLLLVQCYMHTGKLEAARNELETLVKLRPEKESSLRRWFHEASR